MDEVEKCGRRNEECGIKGRFATDYNNMQSAMCIVQLAALRGLYNVPYIESYIRIALLHSRSSRRGDYQSPAFKDVRRTRLPLEGKVVERSDTG